MILLLLAIVNKIGLFPANISIVGFVDGISLLSSIVLLVLNKYIYLSLLGLYILPYLYNINIKDICSLVLLIICLVTIYHGISLKIINNSLRKFLAASSMINVGVLLIIFINWGLDLILLINIHYIYNYIIINYGLINLLILWKDKSSVILLIDINVEVIYNPLLYSLLVIYIIAIAGYPIPMLFLCKFYINCLLAHNNGSSIIAMLIIVLVIAAN